MWTKKKGAKATFNRETDGVKMCAQVFNGKPIRSHAWWEKNWAEESSFEVGAVRLSKAAMVATAADICKSFPGWYFNVVEAPAAQADGTVTCVVEATGTHTGEPYACTPGWEAISATGRAVKNDPERVTTFFNDQGKIVRQTVESLPGGKGFGGPPGFYIQIGGKVPFDVATDGVVMCAEVFNGKPIHSQEWWEKNWSEDGSFEVGAVRLSKAAMVAAHVDICKSFPGWYFNVVEAPAAQANGTVTCVIEATGNHTGEPYACMPGCEAISATGRAVKNDPERVTTFFNDEGKIVKQVAESLPGGKGFGGPPGFYRQIGGKLPFDVTTDGVAICSEIFNGKPIQSQDWWEKNWSEDSSFEVGAVRLPKAAMVATIDAVCKSFPDFYFNVVEAPAAQANGTVTCVIEAAGTHTGEPFACTPGWEAISATGMTVKNDTEKVTTFFNDEGKIVRQIAESLHGGKGFGGPPGLYLQIGGVIPSDDQKAEPEPVSPISPIRGGS